MKFKTINNLIVFCIILIGCNHVKNTEISSGLLVIDANRINYPTYTINIHDIADVEYIPLETTENSLLVRAAVFSVSDKYIITSDTQNGDIWIFNRAGKFLSTFNKRGNGPGEYTNIIKLVCDFDKEEIFIYHIPTKITVYSFNGDHKRTFTYPDNVKFDFCLHNYDSDFLICHNNKYVDFVFESGEIKKIDTNPYYLIRKDNGIMKPIELNIYNRISDLVAEKGMEKGDAVIARKTTDYNILPLFNNGSDIIISDMALDTIYRYNNMKLIPIAYRIPPVKERIPYKVVTAEIDTDYFMTFRITDLVYDPEARYKYFDGLLVVWNKRNKRFEKWNVYDDNYSTDQSIFPAYGYYSTLPANHGEAIYPAHRLVEKYEKGELKGKLKEIASTLKDDDNLVLVLCKYK